MIKIAVTGGPSGGKTSLLDTLKRELGDKVAVAPEAASVLYKGGFPRYLESEAVRCTQRAIFHAQRELEAVIFHRYPMLPLVCDRGSLDGVAYWPAGQPDYFTAIQSTEADELSRYHWVIHLDTAPSSTYDTENVIRTESFKEAIILNDKIKAAWSRHPQRLIIPQHQDFLAKITTSLSLISKIISGADYASVKQRLDKLLVAPPILGD